MELRGRSVLVTGATGWVGQAIARRLGAEGCALTLTGRRADVLDGLARELDAKTVVADLSDLADLARVGAVDVDVLVANAGVPGGGELTDHSPEQIGGVLDVNLRAPMVLSRLVGERMLDRGVGHVVFISSLSAKTVSPANSVYNATKFGLRGFALALRRDWAGHGVGVSCVNPGPVGEWHGTGDGAALPAGFRPRSPEDVAAAVVRAVRRNKAEVDVADPVMRTGVVFGQLAPQTAARLNRITDER